LGYLCEERWRPDGVVLFSWGQNNTGQLGRNDTIQYSSPVQIPGTTWSSISGGSFQSRTLQSIYI